MAMRDGNMAILCRKLTIEKNRNAWKNSVVVEGGIAVSKMCIAMASATGCGTGEPLADGDESGMVALFCERVRDGSEHD